MSRGTGQPKGKPGVTKGHAGLFGLSKDPGFHARIHEKQDNCLVLIAPTARWILRKRTDAQSAAVPIKIRYFNGRVVSGSENRGSDAARQGKRKNNNSFKGHSGIFGIYWGETLRFRCGTFSLNSFLRGSRNSSGDGCRRGRLRERWCRPQYDRSCGTPRP